MSYLHLIQPGVYDLPDPAKEAGFTGQRCINPSCDRLCSDEIEFCCVCCASSVETGNQVVHDQECNSRHAILYRKDLWKPGMDIN